MTVMTTTSGVPDNLPVIPLSTAQHLLRAAPTTPLPPPTYKFLRFT
jgi:hypothetical protein